METFQPLIQLAPGFSLGSNMASTWSSHPLHLVHMSRMSGVTPLFPIYTFIQWTGTAYIYPLFSFSWCPSFRSQDVLWFYLIGTNYKTLCFYGCISFIMIIYFTSDSIFNYFTYNYFTYLYHGKHWTVRLHKYVSLRWQQSTRVIHIRMIISIFL